MAKKKTPRQWRKLDNAAKIFPPTVSARDSKVFRCACELNEDIEPNILKEALSSTLEKFPFYKSVLKKGLFWYYLEESSIEPTVEQEHKIPCAPLYDGINKRLLFDVSYYKKRINLEVYHALSDGTGAVHFLQTLVYYYLTNKYKDELSDKKISIDYDASENQKVDDSFFKYYEKKKLPPRSKLIKAYKLKDEKIELGTVRIIEGKISVKKLLEKAHEHNATLTAFLVALLIRCIGESMAVRDMDKPIVISVPVNLRNFFESQSARNFFGVVNIRYTFTNDRMDIDHIIRSVEKSLKDELTIEKLSERIVRLSSLENLFIAKIIPIVLKNPIMKIANNINDKGLTATFSNVGKIKMPEELDPYINSFELFTCTKKIQVTMCSYKEHAIINFTSPYANTDIERRFFRYLTAQGLDIEITTNVGILEE